jgi:5-(carboxyamino)imidazole ribonucleotide synthase
VTFEFENVPVQTVRHLERWGGGRLRTFPRSDALEVAQDRLAEKSLFSRLAIPTPAYVPVSNAAELAAAVARIGLPAVLKTRRMGYDGKGQRLLCDPQDLVGACESLQGGSAGNGGATACADLIVEEFIPFDREVSMIAVRSATGEEAFYPLVQNVHREGILRVSRAPAHGLSDDLQARARRYSASVVESLDYVGVLAIEFFERGGALLGNEMAPRVHNSGHWTIEGARTSQFENHLRAILGLPLGRTEAVGWSAMVNLIGSTPDPARVLSVPGAHLHLYGKEPRPGRKLGHITIWRDSEAQTEEGVRAIEALL